MTDNKAWKEIPEAIALCVLAQHNFNHTIIPKSQHACLHQVASMGDVVEFECWAWICKREEDCENIIFDASKFKKRKKRWITVTECKLIYSKTAKKSDMKYIQLEHMTAIKTYNESNLEVCVELYIIKNESWNYYDVIFVLFRQWFTLWTLNPVPSKWYWSQIIFPAMCPCL